MQMLLTFNITTIYSQMRIEMSFDQQEESMKLISFNNMTIVLCQIRLRRMSVFVIRMKSTIYDRIAYFIIIYLKFKRLGFSRANL
jgi:hypothetical protein